MESILWKDYYVYINVYVSHVKTTLIYKLLSYITVILYNGSGMQNIGYEKEKQM